jgi:aminopeptidase
MDERWQQLGDTLVNYSTAVQRGERVMIAMHEVETLPLVQAVYRAAVRVGSQVQVQFTSDTLRRSLMQWGSAEQAGWTPEIEAYGMEWADVYFGLRGAHNLYEFADIPADVLSLHQAAMGRISTLRWQKTRWCLVRVPNEAFAWQAQTDGETIMDLFFAACLRDWAAESAGWRTVAERLALGREMRLIAAGTDLRFSVAGRQWIVGDGRNNMPDGEIHTAPLTETVNGYITFEHPAVLSGKLVEGLRLEWRAGELVSATAATHADFLERVLNTDDGARRIGEFAVGTNYGIDRFCKDILFDEKIGGTVHIALGRSYPEAGGTNASTIHWDIVKDTRAEGALYLDGEKVFEKGRFTSIIF